MQTPSIPKLVILDRDGVINYDSELFIKSPSEWNAYPDSLAAIANLNKHGFLVAVATNQSGISRGLFNLVTLASIHDKMMTELSFYGGKIDKIFFCPHTSENNCQCRKPMPGMLLDACNHFSVQPNEAWFVGDSVRDIKAALLSGCSPKLVLTGNGLFTSKALPDFPSHSIFNNLSEFSLFLTNLRHSND